jgi:menaquinone-9 beta-reductase
VSYAIRRREFDAFLLERAGVPVEHLRVTSFQRSHDRWIVNDTVATPVVIGAGGHFCPVSRHLRGEHDGMVPVVAKEAEFQVTDPTALSGMPALYFCRDLAGYAWCVPKDGWVNVGIGRRVSAGFAAHVEAFAAWLARDPALSGIERARWKGHAYLAAGAGTRPLTGLGMLAIGDAAGLAYPESGEGIRPAIASGQLAAATLVAADGRVGRDALQPYAEEIRRQHPPMRRHPRWMDRATASVARMLLRSPAFTRHVVLDRWFLRRQSAAALQP